MPSSKCVVLRSVKMLFILYLLEILYPIKWQTHLLHWNVFSITLPVGTFASKKTQLYTSSHKWLLTFPSQVNFFSFFTNKTINITSNNPLTFWKLNYKYKFLAWNKKTVTLFLKKMTALLVHVYFWWHSI